MKNPIEIDQPLDDFLGMIEEEYNKEMVMTEIEFNINTSSIHQRTDMENIKCNFFKFLAYGKRR